MNPFTLDCRYSALSLETRFWGQMEKNLNIFGVTMGLLLWLEDKFYMLKEIL